MTKFLLILLIICNANINILAQDQIAENILEKLKNRIAIVSNDYKNGKNTIKSNGLLGAISKSKKFVDLSLTKKITG